MNSLFVDTHFWVALTIARDPWHERARQTFARLRGVSLVTTDAVVIELLNFTAGYGAHTRDQVVRFARGLFANPAVEVLPATRQMLFDGLALYESRRDKGYSLTDCMSMDLMRARGITEVLTSDRHFAQEGFVLLDE